MSEVYLTDGVPLGDAGRFRLGAQWPRLHAFYRTCTDRYDTLLLAETVRQCAIYLGHRHYGVPLGHPFTMQTMRVEATLDRLAIGSGAAEVVIDARVTEHARRGSRLSAYSVDVDFLVDGAVAGSAMAVAGVLTPEDYARIRWTDRSPTLGRIPRPRSVPQSAVCVPDERAVVLGAHQSGEGGGRWLLRVDPTHPVLFDHPSDHVPGVVILEAARQSARLRLGWSCADVVALELKFRRFLELDEPTTVSAEIRSDEDGRVDVEFSQWGEPKAAGTVRLAPPRPATEPGHAFVGVHRL